MKHRLKLPKNLGSTKAKRPGGVPKPAPAPRKSRLRLPQKQSRLEVAVDYPDIA